VHLLHIYSNTPELVTDLEAVTWTVRRIDLQDVPALPNTERVSRLRDRLTEPEMAAAVASYSGTSVTQLTRQYDINHLLGRERAIGILVRGFSGRLACGRAATRLADAHPQAPSPPSMLRPEPRASPRVREARMWSSAPDSPEPPVATAQSHHQKVAPLSVSRSDFTSGQPISDQAVTMCYIASIS
jgi:hypothetical protein